MNLRFPTAFHSLRFKLIFGLLLMVIPLVAFMIYNNLYAIGVVRNQVAQSNKNLISLYMKQIDRNLDEVDKYLYTIAAQETGLLVLESPREENSDQYSFTKIQLNNKALKDLPNNKPMEMFFVYSAPNRDLLTVMGNGSTWMNRKPSRTALCRSFKTKRRMRKATPRSGSSVRWGNAITLPALSNTGISISAHGSMPTS
ncbi:hypothetical protein LJK88_18535 [Paenibacillus sp. P26]|nr:hypothetical protein LJK88_18535 [Paenibacillus sp. P26]